MKKELANYAFIDAQNLHIAITKLGWKVDYEKFHVYLKEHYGIKKAYMFMGYKPSEQQMYNFLQSSGFILVFKPILELKDGKVKGNCDAELVLQAMIEYKNYKKAVIVTGDGDFHCLIKYLIEQKKIKALLIPNKYKFSALLKFRICRPYLRFMNDLEAKLAYKKKRPYKDET